MQLVWDVVLGFDFFADAIAAECRMYMSTPTVRRRYGWFLDDRSERDKRQLTNAGVPYLEVGLCGIDEKTTA